MIRHQIISVLLILVAFSAGAQKYNFVNWTVEDGLIQSQASYIYQDRHHQLWIGTEGGISSFDGNKFTGYSVQEGLLTNNVSVMLNDEDDNLWVASNHGVSIFNGRNFRHLKPGNGPNNNVTAMCRMTDSSVLLLNNFKPYKVKNFVPSRLNFSGDTNERVSTISRQRNGDILAFVYSKGIYRYTPKTKTTKIYSVSQEFKNAFVGALIVTSTNDTLMLIRNNLYALRKNQIVPYGAPVINPNEQNFICITEDNRGNLWLGSYSGVYKIENGVMWHYNGSNGLTDNTVSQVFTDLEDNIWFATDGDGIFSFRQNTFTYFDKSSGLDNPIITGVAQSADGSIYAASYGGSLYKVNGNIKKEAELGGTADNKIYCLYSDRENNVWVGTITRGIWKYSSQKKFTEVKATGGNDEVPRGANCITQDQKGNIVIGGRHGIHRLTAKNEVYRVDACRNKVVTSVIPFGGDSLLVGTVQGMFFIDGSDSLKPIADETLSKSYVLCTARQGDNLWIGTGDRGLLNWNFKTGKILHYTTADGLPNNFIYSIHISETNNAWVGTGFGISNIKLTDDYRIATLKNYSRPDGLLGMECNQNCILKAKDSTLWFGTTRGLFYFAPNSSISQSSKPFVILRSVKLFSSSISDSTLFTKKSDWFDVPQQLSLGPNQNHITFELSSIYFTNPTDVIYKYKLEGIDNDYTTSNNPVLIYPLLPPGVYTLNVSAITKTGIASSNSLEYVFEIKKAFYQTSIFQVIVVLALLLTGGLIAWIITRNRQIRKQKAKELTEKIREEEFTRLRQRTAEDFHDEMGNRLTRISVLADMLSSKMMGRTEDVSNLVEQIKENTNSLYKGSRDIIWSLNAQNDGIYEIAEHLKSIGTELFSETHIDFDYMHNVEKNSTLKLQLDFSRNLTMIFKEAYSNILKYSRADKVWVEFKLGPGLEMNISIRDNGSGFDTTAVHSGNGLRNIENRVKRLNGELALKSGADNGTSIVIKLKAIPIQHGTGIKN